MPNHKQQSTNKYLLENQKDIAIILQKELYDYIVESKQSVASKAEAFKFVEIKEVLFLDDGKYMLTFTTSWNTHTSAILFDGSKKIIVAIEDIVPNYF